MLGVLLGEIISVAVLLNLTASWDPRYSFALTGSLLMVLFFLLIFMVRPVRPKLRKPLASAPSGIEDFIGGDDEP